MPAATGKQPHAVPFTNLSSRYTIEAQFPPEVAVNEDPRTKNFHDDAFDLSVSRSFRGNRAQATWEANFAALKVEPDRLASFRETVRKFSEERTGFGIGKLDVNAAATSGDAAHKYREAMERRLNAAVEQVGKSIAS